MWCHFSHLTILATLVVQWFFGQLLLFKVKCLHNYWINCQDIWYKHSWKITLQSDHNNKISHVHITAPGSNSITLINRWYCASVTCRLQFGNVLFVSHHWNIILPHILKSNSRHHLLFEESQLLVSGDMVRSWYQYAVLRFKVLRVVLILTPFSELLS